MTALPSSLSTEQRASVEALSSERVAFPQADRPEYGPGYYRMYAHDAGPLMRAWLADRLTSFVELFGLDFETEADAVVCMRIVARREIGRDLNDNERCLISAGVRHLVVASIALKKRERELARQIL